MSEKAECPHCGTNSSEVFYRWRHSCGWADPDYHEPYRQGVRVDLDPDEAEAALDDPSSVLADIREQLALPPLSSLDGEPVLFTERRPLFAVSSEE